jgi:hypothetical protein
MGLANMYPKYLGLIVNQTQDNMDLANIPHLKNLGRSSKLSSRKRVSDEHVRPKKHGHYQVLRLYV